jgi:hypothetical protein
MEAGCRKFPNAKVNFIFIFHQFLVFFNEEPIPCSIPSLPPTGRYLNHRPFSEQMNDGSQLEYICGNSRHRRRILCRKGKILPRLPKCFHGKINPIKIPNKK